MIHIGTSACIFTSSIHDINCKITISWNT
uniref:Uncharacterized protein n=1 Tax=Rhizophora mucronata TaxID=61149 RepID=A0A2P2P307_RHIMU